MSDATGTDSPLDRMKTAAYERENERRAEERAIEEIVLGKNPNRRTRVTNVVKIGDDYVVEVTDKGEVRWTFVVFGVAGRYYHDSQELAILHLIASRYDDNLNTNIGWTAAAARVLGITEGRPGDNN
ncbi:hypothetical protein ABZY58_11305 [Micromonospora tulbaghiae]|uniref:hypothetical protein n=1 Tax=Micromonospora tulbaghiae TaxID=479978 RepID=UPI0033AC3262